MSLSTPDSFTSVTQAEPSLSPHPSVLIPRSSSAPHCSLSPGDLRPVFQETILSRHPITYYYSPGSGILKTETPYWLAEAYDSAIASTDIGLIERNLRCFSLCANAFEWLFNGQGTLIDIGGGYGMLTRLLRDAGYQCLWSDRYCQNLFAQYHEAAENTPANLLLAFEVMEHVEDAYPFLNDYFERHGTRNLLFSTCTFQDPVPEKDWWYYCFHMGQHITFYQPRTLHLLASKLGSHYIPLGPDFHLFVDDAHRIRGEAFAYPVIRWLMSLRRHTPPRRVGNQAADYDLARSIALRRP